MTRNIQVNYAEQESLIPWQQTSQSSTLVHFLRSALEILKDDNLTNLLQRFDETSDAVENYNVASTILQRAMNLATYHQSRYRIPTGYEDQ